MGEQIEGRVLGNVVSKGAVVVRDGAIVRGRLRGLHRSGDAPGYWVVSLELTDVDSRRFFAELLEVQNVGGAMRTVGGLGSPMTVKIEDLPGIGSFFVKGEKFELPAGFRTVWRTRALQ